VPLLLACRRAVAGGRGRLGPDDRAPDRGVMIGRADSRTVAGSLRSAQEWACRTSCSKRRRSRPLSHHGPGAGRDRAVRAGRRTGDPRRVGRGPPGPGRQVRAELHFEEPVTSWVGHGPRRGRGEHGGRHVHRGPVGHLPGAWAPGLLADLGVPFGVERQVQYWFRPSTDADRSRPTGIRSTSGKPATAASSTAFLVRRSTGGPADGSRSLSSGAARPARRGPSIVSQSS